MIKSLLLCFAVLLFADEIVGERRIHEKWPSHLRAAAKASVEVSGLDSERMKRRRKLAELRQATDPPQIYGPSENLYVAESLDFFKNISPDWVRVGKSI